MDQIVKKKGWFAERFPIREMWNEHLANYYVPKNLNIWYIFGVLALIVLANQLITGIWLAMSYVPTAESAFSSVQHIMRDVNYGWLLRYLHSTGASAFFIIIYLHMFRALMYGSYQKPRELVWLIGMGLFLVLMAEAFMGYLLPWGQMSYWGAQVIISLFGAIPWIGPDLATWIRGDFAVTSATLNRFYALHVIALPLLMLFLVWMHIIALHQVGSNNPDGIDIKDEQDKIPFYPYYVIKDLAYAVIFLIIFLEIVFFAPEMGGYFLEAINYAPANPLQTPDHIAPVWYFTPFYAILRAIPNKLLGVIAMFLSIGLFFFLPWMDRARVRSMRYKGWISKVMLGLFVISFIGLGIIGLKPVDAVPVSLTRILTIFYFAYFLLMPFYSRFDKTKPLPDRVRVAK